MVLSRLGVDERVTETDAVRSLTKGQATNNERLVQTDDTDVNSMEQVNQHIDNLISLLAIDACENIRGFKKSDRADLKLFTAVDERSRN
jgi:type II secretory pathway component PulC